MNTLPLNKPSEIYQNYDLSVQTLYCHVATVLDTSQEKMILFHSEVQVLDAVNSLWPFMVKD